MKIIFTLSSIVLMVILPIANAIEQQKLKPPTRVINQVKKAMSEAKISGLAIAKVKHGKIEWSATFGLRNEKESLTTNSVFNTASLTKPVFSALVLQLIAEGALDLDSSLEGYWIDPDVVNDARHKDLTARTILSHQSGLPNWRGNKKLAFMFKPGDRHEYSGEGFEYLRRAIEAKLNSNLPSLIEDKVFNPAGMKDSAMGWDNKFDNNFAVSFDEMGKSIDTAIKQRKPNAAANLITTVQDYARFIAWVSKGSGLPEKLFNEMRQPQALHANPAERFGLGWKLIPIDKKNVLFHDGREPGVRSYTVINPENHEGLVILTNSSNGYLSFRPLIEASLSYGKQLTEGNDRLAWQYLNSIPDQALLPMSSAIAKSPAFLNTLLHAVNTSLVQTSPLNIEEKTAATKVIDAYVLALLENKITTKKAEKLIQKLIIVKGKNNQLIQAFDAKQAKMWVNSLSDI